MGITIDECIKGLEYLKECGVCPFTDKTGKFFTDEFLDGSIDIIRKYRKIEDIAARSDLQILTNEVTSTFTKDVLEVLKRDD